MVTPPTERQGLAGEARRDIVAFDFDGTLTTRDTYLAFLRWRAGGAGYALGVARLAPHLLAYAFARDRGALKAAATRMFLKGVHKGDLQADAERFAAGNAGGLLRPDALAAWKRHKAEGAEVIVVTASPTAVIAPFAERLGAARLIGTELEWDANGRCTGRFARPNCRAAEKVVRLREVYGDDVELEAAYGDTTGDTQMLAISRKPGMRVFKEHP
jgi:phosphatidylglycerophosphatase C